MAYKHSNPIYPYDVFLLGDCISDVTHDPVLYFWGFSRDNTEDKDLRLQVRGPSGRFYNPKLYYLGHRSENVMDIRVHFQEYFTLRGLDPQFIYWQEMNSNGSIESHAMTSRWPDSNWYFLFPRGEEDVLVAQKRTDIWNTWTKRGVAGDYHDKF